MKIVEIEIESNCHFHVVIMTAIPGLITAAEAMVIPTVKLFFLQLDHLFFIVIREFVRKWRECMSEIFTFTLTMKTVVIAIDVLETILMVLVVGIMTFILATIPHANGLQQIHLISELLTFLELNKTSSIVIYSCTLFDIIIASYINCM